ncbi:phytoene synthase [Halolactibacillus halophilus]|uniref:Phytoene synthase n=1 Tax=Halolactibacillus halophilus TaxID=306540 RepID=A0A1I5QMP7_9BACI|nr:phytoene/squalene synthase family protein [Halolactibacillus halophilus]GEM01858.1 phytoene synthase [Halolactibacillus halophilus]SFP47564.1 phytoene synthase [Halolactibacillus halophilus]
MYLAKDLREQAKTMMKQGSSSFYHAFKFLPRQEREAVYVVYAFCRLIDDAVDEPETSVYTIDEIKTHFDQLEKAEGHFIWPALRWAFDAFPLTKAPYYIQMSGQLLDFKQTEYDTMAALEDYCYRVAGSVGEMLIPILHPDPTDELIQAGIQLGKGMQIVNIIRDVGQDMTLNRRYLPLEVFGRHGYTLTMFDNQEVNEQFKAVIDDLTDQADLWFTEGLAYVDQYPKKSALTLKLAARYYREIIQVVKENEYQVFNKRAFVTDKRKLTLFNRINQ